MHSIIAYKNGIFKKIGDEEFNSLIRFSIIDFTDPSEAELKTFLDRIEFDVSYTDFILSKNEIPCIVHKGDFLYIVFGTSISKNKQLGTAPLIIVLYKGFIILIHKEHIKPLSDLLDEIQTDTSRLVKLSISNILYQILADINDDFVAIVDKLGNEIEITEERLVKFHDQNDVKRVYSLRKTLLFFKSVLRRNNNVVAMIIREETLRQFIKDTSNYSPLYNSINQLINLVDFYREMLTEVMQIYEGALANRLNEIMKYFGVIASIFLWPVLVSSIYGMNFRYIPLASHIYGFYIMLGIMVVGALITLAIFKKKKWL